MYTLLDAHQYMYPRESGAGGLQRPNSIACIYIVREGIIVTIHLGSPLCVEAVAASAKPSADIPRARALEIGVRCGPPSPTTATTY